MAENAVDLTKKIDIHGLTGVGAVILPIGIEPKLTAAEYNAARAAAAGGYPSLRDYINSIKPGSSPWLDHFLSHPTDSSQTPAIRSRWVALVLQGGDL